MNYFNSNIRLLRKRKNRTQSELADELSVKRTTINAIENSISQPTVSHLQTFSDYFGIAIDTLINIDLSQLSESQFTDLQNGFDVFIKGSNLRVIATTVDHNNNDNIEFVNEKAKAGYADCFADPEFIGKLPVFQLPFLSNEKKYRAFTVSGDSMLPVPENSIVIGEFVQDFYDLRSNEAYIIVTRNEGIVFKIVENNLKKDKSLNLISLNKNYRPFPLKASEIKEAWKFVCYIDDTIPEPVSDVQQILESVNQIRKELQNLKAL